MEVIAQYSFSGKEFLEKRHKSELDEVKNVISSVVGSRLKTKISEEKTMRGRALYNPKALNKEFTRLFEEKHWQTRNHTRIQVKTYVPEINEEYLRRPAFS